LVSDPQGQKPPGEIKPGKKFKMAAEQFQREYEIITEGERNPKYVQNVFDRLKNHVVPYFGEKVVTEITPGTVQKYRIHRREVAVTTRGKAAARSTMHQEIVTLKHVLKTANRHGWLPYLPACLTSLRLTGTMAKYRTGLGFHRRSISSFTRQHGAAFRTRRRNDGYGPTNNCMTTCCLWLIPACGPMRRTSWNTGMSPL
jgi:hypothetical protein